MSTLPLLAEESQGETPQSERAWPLEKDCRDCKASAGSPGVIRPSSGQNCLYCACGAYNGYNVPKAKTGEEQRSLRSRADIKPSVKSKVLEWCRFRCWECGKRAPNVTLQLGHIISVADIKRFELPSSLETNEYNLVAVCEECNSGRGKRSFSSRDALDIVLAIIRIREMAG